MFEKKEIEKKTYITINSIDRIKTNKVLTEINYNKIENNGLKIIDYDTLLINHKNHGYDVDEKIEVIFKNIEGLYDESINKYTLGGIPVEYLNFNEELGRPIFVINFIYEYDELGNVRINKTTNKKVSNSYTIRTKFNLDKNIIKIDTVGGGGKIEVEKLRNYIRGYEDSSFYKIPLPRLFKNI